jgi:hypothetical protein
VRSGPTSGAIYWSEDSAIKTPYAHVIDFSIARELRNGSSLELSYVGRIGHRLLEQEDVAMPTNLTAAGTSYFVAARQMSIMARANGGAGVPVSSVQPIAYWQALFGALNGQDIGYGPGFTATQNINQLYQQNLYHEANALYALDMPDAATDAGINPNQAYPSNRFFTTSSQLFMRGGPSATRITTRFRPSTVSASVSDWKLISITLFRNLWMQPRKQKDWVLRAESITRRSLTHGRRANSMVLRTSICAIRSTQTISGICPSAEANNSPHRLAELRMN